MTTIPASHQATFITGGTRPAKSPSPFVIRCRQIEARRRLPLTLNERAIAYIVSSEHFASVMGAVSR
jgi:hypothetical protein